METYFQAVLFNEPSVAPTTTIHGLTYIPEYISAQQENVLIQAIDTQSWITEL